MEYVYPDKNDKLTMELIENEYNESYWAKSEEWVLSEAIAVIKHMKERDDSKKMLDLGCGTGRLLKTFAPYVDELVAAEPDAGRFSQALSEALSVKTRSGNAVTLYHGDASCLDKEDKFDVILSSHVLQHVTRKMAQDLMNIMAEKLEEEGTLVVTTTYSSEEDIFQMEGWNNGERISEVITAEKFDECFVSGDILPVRMFAEDTVKNLGETAGLTLEKVKYYHYLGHHTAEEDAISNGNSDSKNARDVMYVFRKKEVFIDANIGYHFSFSIFDEATGLRTDDESELRESIKKRFENTLFYDEKNADKHPAFADLRTSEGFLHGGGLPFHCFRAILNEYKLSFRNFDVDDSSVMVTVFPESDTVQLWVSLSFRNLTVDDLVYLRHVQGNGAKLKNVDGNEYSIRDIFNEIKNCLGRKITDIEENYLVEIKKYGNFIDIDEITEKNSRQIYGLMCGDEGWRHVPVNLSKERLTNTWGSRNFIRLISFGNNSVFFNLSGIKAAEAYRENRRRFDEEFYGDMNPYFLIDSSFAGISHGVFFSIEMVMVIKTICNRIVRKQAGYYKEHDKNISKDIRQTKDYRGELLTTLRKVENLQLSEIGEMERVMLISQQIDPIIEKIKYLLELVESELDLLYQTSTNKLANALAIGGLIFAGIQIIIGILPLI